MFTNTVDQTKKIIDTMWVSWENGVQQVYRSQQELGKMSLEALKKQQDMLSSIAVNQKQVEDEIKNSLNEVIKLFKENTVYVKNEEVFQLFDTWNEKMMGIVNQIQQLSSTPSKALLGLAEQSHESMYEAVKNALENHNKMHIETTEKIEKFMAQIKDSQDKFVTAIKEQTTKTLEKNQPKKKNA
ncbi:hypothetical protein ACNQFZ_14180 [Schinkia sp. CFF1]